MTKCKHKRRDGDDCRNHTVPGKDHCHWHRDLPQALTPSRPTQLGITAINARSSRRLRDEVATTTADELRHAMSDLRRTTEALTTANRRIDELEATKAPAGRAAVQEAHARRHADDLARAHARLELVNAELVKQRDQNGENARAFAAENARSLAAEQRLGEVAAELAELRSARAGLDADVSAGVELLHERAIELLLGKEPPTPEQRQAAEASTRLADSLIAFARERRRASQLQRRSPARARSSANGDARAGAEGDH